jgi:phosphoenolpyruvate-protein phosphotransferase
MKKFCVKKTASAGYAIGAAYVVSRQEMIIDTKKIAQGEVEAQVKRYEKAVACAKEQLSELAKDSDIFEAHLSLAGDIALYDGVVDKIKSNLDNAEQALQMTCEEYVMVFESMDDEYMRERAADMQDVSLRIMYALKGIEDNPFAGMTDKSIVVANDLTPSDTAKMNKELVLGFLTEIGGVTSHVSIIAKNMGIPCLVGIEGLMSAVETGDTIVMDASAGDIIINPEAECIAKYEVLQKAFIEEQERLESLSTLPCVTTDGKKFELCANVGNIEEIQQAITRQIDGVGLFRSEFLYMESKHFPTEEEQFEVYKEAVTLLDGKEMTIRTLDIGGDKGLDYFEFPQEENPFLGYRAIRICLDKVEIFKTQLRALLRASVYGNLRIMFPMMISVSELRKAKDILEECKAELQAENLSYKDSVEIGIMIETPASVLLAEDFAKYVDFFSIGTNDLTQYMLAVDRGNLEVASLYNSYEPAVLRAINTAIQAGHKHDVKVGMCGEFASDEDAAIMLLGMGLDEFSMSAAEVARVKYKLRNVSYENAKECANKVLAMETLEEVMDYLGGNE